MLTSKQFLLSSYFRMWIRGKWSQGRGQNLGLTTTATECDGRRRTRMQRARYRVEHWPARKHVCMCADSECFSAIAPEPPTSPSPMRTNPLAAATRATAHPHWSVAFKPATVAERIPRNRRPPPSKPTRPYVANILIDIVSVI